VAVDECGHHDPTARIDDLGVRVQPGWVAVTDRVDTAVSDHHPAPFDDTEIREHRASSGLTGLPALGGEGQHSSVDEGDGLGLAHDEDPTNPGFFGTPGLARGNRADGSGRLLRSESHQRPDFTARGTPR